MVLCLLQAGHLTKKNKKCTMYSEEEPEIVAPWLPDLHLTDPPTQVCTPNPTPTPMPHPYRAPTSLNSCIFGLPLYPEVLLMAGPQPISRLQFLALFLLFRGRAFY